MNGGATAGGAPRPETDTRRRPPRRRLTQAHAELRTAKAAAYPRLQPQFAALAEGYQDTVADLRHAAVAGGLAWGTANAITWDYIVGARQAALQRKRGLPARLQVPPWDGTGTVTVQLSRVSGETPRSPALLADPRGRYRHQALLQPWIDPGAWQAMAPQERAQ